VQNFSQRIKGAIKHLIGSDFDACPNPIEAGDLRAVCHDQWPDDPALVAAWNDLCSAAPSASTFHSPTWQKAVVECLAKPGRLRLIVVWQGARLVAVLPMSIRDDGLLETFAPGVSDYLDPLILPELEPQVWPLLLKLFSRLRAGKWKNVTLHNIRDDAPCRTLLPELAAAEGFAFEARTDQACPCLTLPKTWDDYLATLDAHERKETRRKINKVMTKGAGRLVRCSSDPAEIATSLATALALMEKAPGEKGEAVKRTLRPLLEKAAPALIANNQLWLTTLYVNNEPAACTLQFPQSAGPQLYNCGFDNTKREWSTGVVLTAQIIQQAIESGAKVFDLLRGEEPYKYKLGAVDRPLWMMTLRHLH
jgi:CelD/BcsL family acetyltransferase involved in cellulose biosynthesis